MVNYLDPVGVGARDLRECLLIQICAQQGEAAIVLRRRQMTAADAAARNGAAGDEEYACGGARAAAAERCRSVRMSSALRRIL